MSFFGLRAKFKNALKGPQTNTRPLFLCAPFVTTVLVTGSFGPIVQLPALVDKDEWLAAHAFDFFHYVSLFCGTISEFCTVKECPTMTIAQGVEYPWIDGQKRSIRVAAPLYVDHTTTWIHGLLDDEQVFPTKSGRTFPKDHQITVRAIFKQLFRIIAHIYNNHYERILHLNQEGHLNTLFAHFICFAKEFDLLDKKETDPMRELIGEFESHGLC